nr:MAG: hypothetical protein DIU78_04545 [Pseudomonadota bacterium]
MTEPRDRDIDRDGSDLVTALTAIVGALELLLETDLDVEQRRLAQGALSGAQMLTRVLRRESVSMDRDSLPPDSMGGEGGRVLVVEDDDFTRALLERALAAVGCRVDTAVSGMDAVQKFATAVYDIVLMDCHLPGVDGFETAREIRRLESERDRVPVIAVTAAGIDGLREACRAAGMDDVITKPFEFRPLRERVPYWVARAREAERTPSIPSLDPSAPIDDAERLDPSRIEELASEAGTAVALELAEIFLDDVGRRVTSLQRALGDSNREGCLALAHSIKGASANFGAVRMAALAEALERLVKNGSPTLAAHVGEELASELAVVRTLLEARGLCPPSQTGARQQRTPEPS